MQREYRVLLWWAFGEAVQRVCGHELVAWGRDSLLCLILPNEESSRLILDVAVVDTRFVAPAGADGFLPPLFTFGRNVLKYFYRLLKQTYLIITFTCDTGLNLNY